MPIKVAIVEDNPDLCEELQQTLSEVEDFTCVVTCRNAKRALERLPEAQPDVALMDIRLPDGTGIELVEKLIPLLPETQFVMLTMYQDNEHILDALGAGAIGYLLKDSSSEEIVQAIRDASQGNSPLSGEVARKVVNDIHRHHQRQTPETKLTPREQEVMKHVAKGLADKQIADELHISLFTVNSHLKNIYAKLNVQSRAAAISRYFMVD